MWWVSDFAITGHVSLPFMSFVLKYSKVSFVSIQNFRYNLIHNTVDSCCPTGVLFFTR